MITSEQNAFCPDWISAPGETIEDILEERNVSVKQFAEGIDATLEQADALFEGRIPITVALAERLQKVVGGSAGFWISRESDYRKDLSRLAVRAQRKQDEEWAKRFPLLEMASFGWLEPVAGDQVGPVLQYFNVQNVQSWRDRYQNRVETAAFRTSPSFESDLACVSAWLRQGEIESESILSGNWDVTKFNAILPGIRALTRERNPQVFIPELRNRCADCGVAVVVLRAPKGCRASGATYFISPQKAVLLLSFRYLSDDHFWFTFFHEAGHLVLHGADLLFLEGVEAISAEKEDEANDFAASILIPDESRASMLRLAVRGIEVIRFARTVGVSPGIVVGQMQHYGRLTRRQLNNLKRRFVWKD
jgi:HTH-type transcriptional regulator / antitoxin HigA